MSDQSATSAPASDAKHWVFQSVTIDDELQFLTAVTDLSAEGCEVVGYSTAFAGNTLVYSALLRRRASADEHLVIHQRRIERFEEGIAQNPIPR